MRSFQLVLKIIILCSATTFSYSLKAQTLAGLALKNLERQKWQRAGELLSKALSKDSLNVTAKYVLAQYFFSEGNPAQHLDSAYRYSLEAMDNYSTLTLRQRERLKKFPLDSALLVEQRDNIEVSAFDVAASERTEAAFNHFIHHFTSATSLPRAIHLRDSIAYNTAASLNTYDAFLDFLTKYPASAWAGDARENYEKILFEVRTADQSLAAYEGFLHEHPTTPFRRTIEENIFEYRTAAGDPDDFRTFIHECPTNAFVRKAGNILFHLIPPSQRFAQLPASFMDDSVRRVLELDNRYLVPFLHNKKYGLMNAAGLEIIGPSLDSLDEVYHCGNIDEDVIAVNNQLMAKNGTVIWSGPVAAVDDLGAGFLIIEDGTCKSVIHKSGFAIGKPCIDDARVLNSRFIALRNAGKWSVWTLSGRQLLSGIDNIRSFKNVASLQRDKTIELITFADLSKLPEQGNAGAHKVESSEPWSHNLILVRRSDESALLDQSLSFLVPFGHKNLSPTFFGGIVRDTAGAHAFNLKGITSKEYQKIVVAKHWLAARDSSWYLLDPVTLRQASGPYDSVSFSGSAALAMRRDSTFILFDANTILRLKKVSDFEYIPATDSTFYLVISLGNEKNVYDHRGKKLFVSTYDRIQYAGGDYFIAHRKEKKALLTSSGKVALPPEYDAIGMVANGKISLLRSMRFGMFDCFKNQLIKPAFDKNMVPYNTSLISACRDGLFGLVDWKSKPATKFEFNEIEYWNDTTMLAKKNSKWMLYEIKTGNILLDDIRDISYIRNHSDDKLAIVYAGTNHGVLHNRLGTIIPISFTDLVNVGSQDVPMYFTEKHVEEASIFVVIYYDHEGKLIRKEVYDQADYDSIFCHTK